LLQPLAKQFDGTLFAQEVWLKLAETYVRVERTPDEIRAYDEVIARAVLPESTITPLLNQGEAYMRNGNIDEAIAQFREVYRLAALAPYGNEVGVLAQWDLAVALDRSGDERGALAAAGTAVRLDGRCLVIEEHALMIQTPCNASDNALILVPAGMYPIASQNPSVYFVPEYERSWYLALGREALALGARTPGVAVPARDAADHWKRAETEMMQYVSEATLHGGDKWLERARKRLDEIRARRAEADKRAGIHREDL
jgi:tetratricopeptide (TPR) repeat protein